MGEWVGEGARIEIYRAAKDVIKMARKLADYVEELDISEPSNDDVNDMIYARDDLQEILANRFGMRREDWDE
jgi:hypothetical protein